MFGAEAPHNINNHWSATPHGLLQTIADSMATLGSNHLYLGGESFIVLSPEHADVLAKAGWRKRDVRAFLFEHARKPLSQVRIGGMYGPETRRNLWPRWIDHDNDRERIPIARRPEDSGHPGGWRRRSSFGVSAGLGGALGDTQGLGLTGKGNS